MSLRPEREFAKQHGIGRSTVCEPMIAFEISGMVEVRVGSRIYVLDTSKQKEKISNKIAKIGYAPLELIEAR